MRGDVRDDEKRQVMIKQKHRPAVPVAVSLNSPVSHDPPISHNPPISHDPPQLHFDEFAYISQGRLKEGEDAYKRYAFNQQASEQFRSNRIIMDTRHYM